MIDVVLVTNINRRIFECLREIRIGRCIYPCNTKKVSHYRTDGTIIGECLLYAYDPSSSTLDRENLNVGIITIRKRETSVGTGSKYMSCIKRVDVGEIGGLDGPSR